MTDVSITVFAAVISGVIIALVAQIIIRFVLDPMQEFQKARIKVSFNLHYYSFVFTNPGKISDQWVMEASEEIRKGAMTLKSFSGVIPLFGVWASIFRLPSKGSIIQASMSMIRISNSLRSGNPFDNVDSASEIFRLLKIDANEEWAAIAPTTDAVMDASTLPPPGT